MTEPTESGALFDRTIEQAGQVQHALGHLVAAIKLELEEIASENEVDPASKEKLSQLRQSLFEITKLAMSLESSFSEVLDVPANEREPDREVAAPVAVSQNARSVNPKDVAERSLINPERLGHKVSIQWFANKLALSAESLEKKEVSESERRQMIVALVARVFESHPAVQEAVDDSKKKATLSSIRRGKLDKVSSYPQLTQEKEREFFDYIKAGVATYESVESFEHISEETTEAFVRLTIAQSMLLHAHLRFVVKNVFELAKDPSFNKSGCIDAGKKGLKFAIRGWDSDQGGHFEDYAREIIRQHIIEKSDKNREKYKAPPVIKEPDLPVQDDTSVKRESQENLEERIRKSLGGSSRSGSSRRARHGIHVRHDGRDQGKKATFEQLVEEMNAKKQED